MDLVSRIEKVLGGPVCIVGVGNYIRRDDAVGLYLVDRLRKDCTDIDGVEFLNAEDVIESYVFEIADKPCGSVLLVDAVSSKNEPGSVLFGELDEFESMIKDLSTHKLSMKLAGKIWKEKGKKTYLLGIEALDTDFGEGLTDAVKKSADMLNSLLVSTLNSTRKEYVYEQ